MKQLLMLLMMSIVFIGVSCDGDDPVECKNECATNGTTSCKDAKTMQACTLQTNGCNIWVPTECTGTNTCVEQNDSVAGCVEEIVVDTCTDGGNECAANTNGKTDCVANVCVTPAATECTADAKRCNADNVETCKADGSAWEVTTTCAAPKKCDATSFTCEEETTTECTADEQRCNNDDVETCKADGSAWEVTTDCTGTEKCDASSFTCEEPNVGCSKNTDCELSEICSTNVCMAIAEGDACTEVQSGTTRCEDADTLLVCAIQTDMSYAWESTDCSTTSCVTDTSSDVDGCQI